MRETSLQPVQHPRDGESVSRHTGPRPMARTAIVHRSNGTTRPVQSGDTSRHLRPLSADDTRTPDSDGSRPVQPETWSPAAPPVRQRVGPTIKGLRLRQQQSLHALANTANVSPSHLSRIERGLTVPSYDVLDRIADALGSDLRQLRTEEERARAIDRELDQIFDHFDLSGTTRSELLHLTNRARAELARSMVRMIRRTA